MEMVTLGQIQIQQQNTRLYDDTNHQMTAVFKCMIDLSDYGTGDKWSTTTFNLGVRIKANSNQGYIYGNLLVHIYLK